MAFESFLRNLPQRTVHAEAGAFGGAAGSAPGAAAKADPRDGQRASDMVAAATEAVARAKPVRVVPKVGRNDPCPCGSGKKYKQCCGK